jgi:GLPGLI family protein
MDFSKKIDENDPLKSYFSDKIKTYNHLSEFLFIKVHSKDSKYNVFFDDILLPENIPSSELVAIKSLILPFSPIYYIDKQYYTQNTIINDIIKFDEKEILEWQILDETKNILGYECIKAQPINVNPLYKENLSLIPSFVWFCPELNFKASPSLFSNLPGAILEINYTNFSIYVNNIQLSNENLFTIDLSKRKILNYKQFKSLFTKNK